MTSKRQYDVAFSITFIAMAAGALLSDSLVAFNIPVSADSPNSWARFVFHSYAENCDPFYAANPFFNQVAGIFSVFLFAPLYIYLAIGFYKADARIRVPALVFAGALIYAVLLHIVHEFFYPAEELRVQNIPKYFAYSLLYLLVPVLLILRLRKGF